MTENPSAEVWRRMIDAERKEVRRAALLELEPARSAAVDVVRAYDSGDRFDRGLALKIEALAVALGMRGAKP